MDSAQKFFNLSIIFFFQFWLRHFRNNYIKSQQSTTAPEEQWNQPSDTLPSTQKISFFQRKRLQHTPHRTVSSFNRSKTRSFCSWLYFVLRKFCVFLKDERRWNCKLIKAIHVVEKTLLRKTVAQEKKVRAFFLLYKSTTTFEFTFKTIEVSTET